MAYLKNIKLIFSVPVIILISLAFIGIPNNYDSSNIFSVSKMKNNGNIIELKNSGIKLKVIPRIGGRIVSLQKDNGNNILKSDSTLWNYKFDKPVSNLIDNEIIHFNGHIVWVGPQSEWWTHQNIIKDKKDEASRWPPDPYLIYGNFNILKLEDNYVKMIGPKSKYTGVQLTKEINIKDDGTVLFKVEAENIRNENIVWDLWMNTRIDGFNKVYVPVKNNSDLRVEYRNNSFDKMPYAIIEGFFTFKTKMPSFNKNKIGGKAFINPNSNNIFAFTDSEMFVISFDKYEKNLVHPQQGMVEIYNSVTKNGDALMELEYHTPYETIEPNHKINSSEKWQVIEYRNGSSVEEHIRFIKIFQKLTEEATGKS